LGDLGVDGIFILKYILEKLAWYCGSKKSSATECCENDNENFGFNYPKYKFDRKLDEPQNLTEHHAEQKKFCVWCNSNHGRWLMMKRFKVDRIRGLNFVGSFVNLF
jgi:hypothetical protein